MIWLIVGDYTWCCYDDVGVVYVVYYWSMMFNKLGIPKSIFVCYLTWYNLVDSIDLKIFMVSNSDYVLAMIRRF